MPEVMKPEIFYLGLFQGIRKGSFQISFAYPGPIPRREDKIGMGIPHSCDGLYSILSYGENICVSFGTYFSMFHGPVSIFLSKPARAFP